MRLKASLMAVGIIVALSACSKKADEPEAIATGTPVTVESVEAEPSVEPVVSEAASEASPTPTPTVVAGEIPAALLGRWGMVPKDCTSKLGDAKGLLTIAPKQLKFYEAVAKLGKVKEADESRVRATFQYSGEGMTWTQDVVLDAQDGGKTLIRRDYGPDALPGPQKYTRCS